MAAYTTIDDPSAYFKVQLYTGNAGTQSITFNDTDTAMQPDLNWIKCRGAAENHVVSDSVRGSSGSGGYYAMHPNNTDSDQTNTTNLYVSSLDSNGFSVGSNDQVNVAQAFVSMNWKESATAGFDIVAHTGNSSNHTVAHSLSAVPEMVISKNRSAVSQWQVYTKTIGNTKALQLNGSAAPDTSSTYYNNTSPTSSVFTVGTDTGTNGDGNDMIVYLFRSVKGFSKISGTYVGNGNVLGANVFCGFKPAWVMVRRYDSGDSWVHGNNKTLGYNTDNQFLLADTTAAESPTDWINFYSTGFQLIRTDASVNASGGTYLYTAFAENPFVTSTGIPATAR